LTKERDALNQRATSTEQQLKSLQSQLDALTKERDALHQSSLKLSKDSDQHRSDVTKIPSYSQYVRITTIRYQCFKADQKLSSLQSHLDALTKERDSLNQSIAKLNVDNDRHRIDVRVSFLLCLVIWIPQE
jgi:uncharacterized coiled-coil DUF342 family protein